MNLKSHIILSLFLAKKIRINCIPFLFGSVEPDLFLFSYLKGFLKTKRMSGHEYENMRIRSEKILKKIEGSRRLLSYRLGKLMHYLADSFTYAHNSCFEGKLKDHMLYEDRLLLAIEEIIRDEDVIPAFFSSAWDYVEKMHDDYLLKKHCEKTDAEYILSVSFSVAFALGRKGSAWKEENTGFYSISKIIFRFQNIKYILNKIVKILCKGALS